MAYDDRETGLTVEDRGSKLGLPQNQDAEANVLAAMLLSPEVVEEAQFFSFLRQISQQQITLTNVLTIKFLELWQEALSRFCSI